MRFKIIVTDHWRSYKTQRLKLNYIDNNLAHSRIFIIRASRVLDRSHVCWFRDAKIAINKSHCVHCIFSHFLISQPFFRIGGIEIEKLHATAEMFELIVYFYLFVYLFRQLFFFFFINHGYKHIYARTSKKNGRHTATDLDHDTYTIVDVCVRVCVCCGNSKYRTEEQFNNVPPITDTILVSVLFIFILFCFRFDSMIH